MFIFQLATQDTPVEATANWTVQDVLKRFPDCPFAVAQILAKTANPAQQLPDIQSAVKKLTRIAEKHGGLVLQQLRDPTLASLFVSHPKVIVGVAEASNDAAESSLAALRSPWVAERFVKHPYAFLEIARATGSKASHVFDQLIHGAGKAFDQAPDTFVQIAKAARNGTGTVFYRLQSDKNSQQLLDRYLGKEISFDRMMMHFYPQDSVAVELGRPLDDLHDNPVAQKKYLDSLSPAQVLGLLVSNPEYFYTTTNHMLVDRLKSDLEGRPVTELLKEYHVGEEEIRNLLFRAINYDRFYGRENALLNANELQAVLGSALKPLTVLTQETRYYFQMANALENVAAVPEVRKTALAEISERLQQARGSNTSVERALEYLVYQLDPVNPLLSDQTRQSIGTLKERGVYQPENYMQGGKVTVVQVFDRNDTEKDHWGMSQQWFSKYGKATEGPNGERIYETENARIILFMGGERENQRFVANQLKETPNLILTFRGHSYNLPRNIPYDLFGNQEGHVLFIPGSCGSAGSTSEYMGKNPNTDLRFFSNTSTGRGQVTNAIVDALINTSKPTALQDVLQNARPAIERAGGDTATIKAWSAGQALLAYANQK